MSMPARKARRSRVKIRKYWGLRIAAGRRMRPAARGRL